MLRAKETCKNAFDQVLAIKGHTYTVTDETKRCFYFLNELHSETPVWKRDIGKHFDIVEVGENENT